MEANQNYIRNCSENSVLYSNPSAWEGATLDFPVRKTVTDTLLMSYSLLRFVEDRTIKGLFYRVVKQYNIFTKRSLQQRRPISEHSFHW